MWKNCLVISEDYPVTFKEVKNSNVHVLESGSAFKDNEFVLDELHLKKICRFSEVFYTFKDFVNYRVIASTHQGIRNSYNGFSDMGIKLAESTSIKLANISPADMMVCQALLVDKKVVPIKVFANDYGETVLTEEGDITIQVIKENYSRQEVVDLLLKLQNKFRNAIHTKDIEQFIENCV